MISYESSVKLSYENDSGLRLNGNQDKNYLESRFLEQKLTTDFQNKKKKTVTKHITNKKKKVMR